MTRTTRIVYTAAPGMRSPWKLLAALWRDFRASRHLSWRLFVRDVSAQYRQSILGVTWAFVPPIVTSLIFIVLQARNVVNFGTVDVPYPVYVMVGALLWQVFVEAVNAPLKAVTSAKPVLTRINFPREALIVAAFYSVVYGVLTKLVVIVGVLLVFGVPLGWGMLAALGPILMLIVCGLAAGVLVTPFGLLYSDVSSGLPVATQLLFFVTPVVYVPPSSFPFSLITVLNPVSPLLVGARSLITKGTLADPVSLAVVCALSFAGLLVALLVYRMALPIFIERVGA